MWYPSVHVEHPFDHPSSFIILLGWLFYNKKEVDSCSKPKLVNKLLAELRKLIIICQKNLYHAQVF